MSTTKTTIKKAAAKSAATTTKAAPRTKPPVKAKQASTASVKPERVNVETVKTESGQKPATNKEMNPTSERFERASVATSEANRAFLSALQERCRLMGTSLKGESCGIRNASPELAAVNEQIKFARQGLDVLLQERRKLMNVSPELEALNLKIAELRKARSRARQEKKAAAAELGI